MEVKLPTFADLGPGNPLPDPPKKKQQPATPVAQAPLQSKPHSASPLTGMHICVTGAFGMHRGQVNSTLQNLGAVTYDDVRHTTTHLLVGKKPGSKLKRGQARGLPILSSDDINQIAGRRVIY